MKLLFYTFLFIYFLIGCKEEPINISTNQTTNIHLFYPSQNDTIFLGDPLHIEGEISSSVELFGYRIELVNAVSDSLLFCKSVNEKSNGYNIHEHWVNYQNTLSSAKLKIEVLLDNEGSKHNKELTLFFIE